MSIRASTKPAANFFTETVRERRNPISDPPTTARAAKREPEEIKNIKIEKPKV